METVAIYNPDDHLLTLHSPSTTSTKLWPGGLGLVRWLKDKMLIDKICYG